MSEVWKDIPGWVGFYQVSDLGRVKSLARTIDSGRPGVTIDLRERILRASVAGHGYLVVVLTRRNDRTTIPVYRLVLAAFVGPCPDGMEGCHNDGDKTNNTPANLRWDTRSENIRDTVRHGNHQMASKTHCAKGHPFAGDNLYESGGRRYCRTCRSVRHLARKQASS